MNADVRALLDWAKEVGWEVDYTGAGHWKLTYGSEVVYVPSTPSDWRSLRNTEARMAFVSGVRRPRGGPGQPRKGLPREVKNQQFNMADALREQRRREEQRTQKQELWEEAQHIRARIATFERVVKHRTPRDIAWLGRQKRRLAEIAEELRNG